MTRPLIVALAALALAGCQADAPAGSDPDPVIPAVAVSPSPAPSLAPGGTLTFTASVTGLEDVTVTWTVREGAPGGTITQGGLYTAPGTAGTYHVVATAVADASVSGSAAVTVTGGNQTGLAAQLAKLAGKAIFFGHQSVGGNIMEGVRALLDGNSGAEPVTVTTRDPNDITNGVWADEWVGDNLDPGSKVDDFAAVIRGGVGAKVDLAFLKFCWVDFDDGSTFGSPSALFTDYRTTLAALRAEYPAVTFVHFTAPLFEDTEWNARREAYNALLRAHYAGVEPIFDLALVESTRPDGTREIGTYGPALVPAYSEDGGHLNATGREKVARALVATLAALP